MFWNEAAETMEYERLRALQTERLKDLVNLMYQKQPFYRSKMQEAALLPQDIQNLDDIAKLPFTTKQNMHENYPYGLFAAPPNEIVRIHASSGTTGKPTAAGYTRKDIGVWAEVVARALTGAGLGRNSYIQVAYGYGLFTGGLGAHYGAELIGASVIPASIGNTARQVMMIKDFGTNALACTPSYALYIAETMKEMGINPQDTALKVGIFGAEPWSEEMRTQIETGLGVKALDIYGLSEIIGPGVSSECLYQNGLHINEDHFYPEIIDPVTEKILPCGEKGELVITTLTRDGMPMVRYRTRDITYLKREVCDCGRTLVRMGKVLGRSDDMLIIRGVNIFPSQVETVLLSIAQTTPNYQLIVDRKDNLDVLSVMVEVSDEMFSDEIRGLENLEREIKTRLASALSVSAQVRLVGLKTLERSEGKAKRVIDKRKI